MILPQVHLRKPCYDFYFVEMKHFKWFLRHNGSREATKGPIRQFQYFIHFVVATGGVYKGQGRNQREMMTHTY